MTDITKCYGYLTDNHVCPKKEHCYRHTAPNDGWQAYFTAPVASDDKCEYFWENKE
jgi:hypothetical protein